MTDQRPHMRTEDFEAVARIAAGEREGTRLEFIDGVIRSKAMPDGDHQMIIQWLTRICMQHRPELWLHGGQGIKAQEYRGDGPSRMRCWRLPRPSSGRVTGSTPIRS